MRKILKKSIRFIIKSFPILGMLIFITGSLFAYMHSDIMQGDYNQLQRSIQGVADFYIWMIFASIWGLIYMTGIEIGTDL